MDAVFGCQGYLAEEGGGEVKLFKGDCLASSQLPLCVCALYELYEVGLIHSSLLTKYKEPQRVWRKFVKS